MLNVTLEDIQSDLLKYLHQVEEGETIIVFKTRPANC